MSKNLSHLLYLPLFIFLPSLLFAQADTSFVKIAVDNALRNYKEAVGVEAHLYNGPEYFVPGKPHIEGHQYFQEKIYHKGTVKYDGAPYEDVPMLYDIQLDELIIIHPGSGHPQQLVKRRVAAFTLHDRSFVYLQVDSLLHKSMRPGFYNVLHDGRIKMLVRHEKTLYERASTTGMEGKYKDGSRYYLFKDGTYHQVSNKGSVMRVLQDQKKALKKFAGSNNLRFKKYREEAIFKTVQHYDTLQD